MSNKQLLSESTIRRFMKLASIDKLSGNFISEMGMSPKRDDDDEEEDMSEMAAPGLRDEEEDLTEIEIGEDVFTEEEEPEGMDDMAMDDEPVDMDADMGDDLGDEGLDGDADMSLSTDEVDLLIDLGKRLESASAGEAGMEDAPMDDAPMDDAPMDDAPMDDAPMDDKEDLVSEILRRVTKRLLRSKMGK